MSFKHADFKAKVASKRTPVADVEIPALNEGFVPPRKVYLCKPSAADRDRQQKVLLGIGDAKNSGYRASVVISVACDEYGNKLFTQEDEAWLSALDYDILDPIVNKHDELFRAVKPGELEKNSGSPTGDSATA